MSGRSVIGSPPDEQTGESPGAVEQRHEFGHGSHGHAHGSDGADATSEQNPGDNPLVRNDVAIQQGHDDSQEHPAGGNGISPNRRTGVPEHLQPKDEKHRCDNVAQFDGGAHLLLPLDLNMASIRWVTQ